jgi:hypothetical protein
MFLHDADDFDSQMLHNLGH